MRTKCILCLFMPLIFLSSCAKQEELQPDMKSNTADYKPLTLPKVPPKKAEQNSLQTANTQVEPVHGPISDFEHYLYQKQHR